MWAYIGKRLLIAIPVLIGLSIIVFAMMALIPGDPATAILGSYATPENVERLNRELGLDKSLPEQYFDLARQSASWRFGPLLFAQPAGARRGVRAFRRHADPRRDLAGALLAPRPCRRHRLGGAPVRLDRPHRHLPGADRHLDALLLARPAHDPAVRGRAQMAAGLGHVRHLWRRRPRRPPPPSRHAGDHARGRGDGRHRPAHPHRHARGAAPGLYPHRARQGADRAPRHLPPRLQGGAGRRSFR